MMIAIITSLIGFFLGLAFHVLTMKISFKQRTLDNKIKVYDAIITSWVKLRNVIFSPNNPQEKLFLLDNIYGESQTYIGEIFLVTENNELAININEFNEKFYRQNWLSLDRNALNQTIEALKSEALLLVNRMREDIQASTILTKEDIFHIWSGLKKNKIHV